MCFILQVFLIVYMLGITNFGIFELVVKTTVNGLISVVWLVRYIFNEYRTLLL